MTKSTSKSKEILSTKAIKKHSKLTSHAVISAAPEVLDSPPIYENTPCPNTITVDVVKSEDSAIKGVKSTLDPY